MIELPDLSHLTAAEQQKIKQVIKRQQDEEQKEKNMLKVIHNQFEDYKKQINNNNSSPVAVTTNCESAVNGPSNNSNVRKQATSPQSPASPSCEVCHKTKFALGCGNDCIYCDKKVCSRCSARIKIIREGTKSSKVMWVCNGCRKQQDVLLKSGRNAMVPNLQSLINLNIYSENDRQRILDELKHASPSNGVNKISDNSIQNGESYSVDSALRSSSDMTVDVLPSSRKQSDFSVHDNVAKQLMNSSSQNTIIASSEKHSADHLPLDNDAVKLKQDTSRHSSPIVKHKIPKSQSNISHLAHPSNDLPLTSLANSRPQSSINLSKYSGNYSDAGDSPKRNSPKLMQKRQSRAGSPRMSSYGQNSPIPKPRGLENKPHLTPSYDNAFCRSEPNLAKVADKQTQKSTFNQSNLALSEHQKRILKCLNHNYSISSSEEEIHSTPDYSSFDDAEKEFSISDDDYYGKKTSRHCRKFHRIQHTHQSAPTHSQSVSKFTEPSCTCDNILPQNQHIPTSASCNAYPSSLSQSNDHMPVSWQPSLDGKFLIGHLILNKTAGLGNSSLGNSQMLGLKVVGGKMTKVGRRGAFITKVKKGGLADVVGHLKPGDEVISWSGNCLQDASFDEVYNIILTSKHNDVVELIVSRPIKDVPRIPETRLRHTAESSSCSLDSERKDIEVFDSTPLKGVIQIKMSYKDPTQELYVTAIQAAELPLREGGLPRNPYLKMYLLPDRSNIFKRRTKTAKKTLCPDWNQTFVYSDVRRDDLGAMALELSLWDYDRSLEANSKFMGEVMVDIGLVSLKDEPQWFKLMPIGHGMKQDYTAPSKKTMPKESSSMNIMNSSQLNRDAHNNKSYTQFCQQQPIKTSRITSHSTNTIGRRQLPDLPSSIKMSNRSPEKQTNVVSPKKLTTPTTNDSNSIVSNSVTDSFSNMKIEHGSVEKTLQTFVGGLGPGQVVGRQVLAVQSVGELECGLYERNGQLEVQVIRARNLLRKPGAKIQPATYVKVYLMFGMQYVAKKKTKLSRRTVNPTYHQTLLFDPSQYGKSIQLIVWGDYGRLDNKVFMGVAQISLEGLELSSNVIGWYKLFPISCFVDTSVLSVRKESSSSFGSSSRISSRDYSD